MDITNVGMFKNSLLKISVNKNIPSVWRHFVPKVSRGFFNFCHAHKRSHQRSSKILRKTKGIYDKTRITLRRREKNTYTNIGANLHFWYQIDRFQKLCVFLQIAHDLKYAIALYIISTTGSAYNKP